MNILYWEGHLFVQFYYVCPHTLNINFSHFISLYGGMKVKTNVISGFLHKHSHQSWHRQFELMQRDRWLKRTLSWMPLFEGPPPITIMQGDTFSPGHIYTQSMFPVEAQSPQQFLLYRNTTQTHFH